MSAKRKKKDQVFTESTMSDIPQDDEKQVYGETKASNQNQFAEQVYNERSKNDKTK